MIESSLNFDFQENDNVHFSGKTVNGLLIVNLSGLLEVEEIHVKLQATSCIRVTRLEENSIDQFYECLQIIHSPSNRKGLAMGENYLPFSMPLPANIPPSWEDEEGFVRYELTAIIIEKKNESTTSHSVRAFISVNNIVNCNLVRKAMVGKKDDFERMKFCGMTRSIFAAIKAFQRAFVPGDEIVLTSLIQNHSNTPIHYVRIVLEQKVKLRNAVKIKRWVSEILRGSIMPHATQVNKQRLAVPTIPCTTSTNVMTIQYKIKLIIVRTNNKKSLKLKIPVTIGNIPHKDKAASFVQGHSDIELRNTYDACPFTKPCVLSTRNNSIEYIPSYITYCLQQNPTDENNPSSNCDAPQDSSQ